VDSGVDSEVVLAVGVLEVAAPVAAGDDAVAALEISVSIG
jgi:hypothetical protein